MHIALGLILQRINSKKSQFTENGKFGFICFCKWTLHMCFNHTQMQVAPTLDEPCYFHYGQTPNILMELHARKIASWFGLPSFNKLWIIQRKTNHFNKYTSNFINGIVMQKWYSILLEHNHRFDQLILISNHGQRLCILVSYCVCWLYMCIIEVTSGCDN